MKRKSPALYGAGLFYSGLLFFGSPIFKRLKLGKYRIKIFADGSPIGAEGEKVRFTGIGERVILGERVANIQDAANLSKKLGVA